MKKTWSKEELSILNKNLDAPIEDVCKLFHDRSYNSVHVMWKRLRQKRGNVNDIEEDIAILQNKKEEKDVKKKYVKSLEVIQELQNINNIRTEISKDVEKVQIISKVKKSTSEATAFLCASDWHMEEEVNPDKVNGLNKYNLDIASERANNFFINGLRLVDMNAKEVNIKNIVLYLGGDFGSGNIHEELLSICKLPPMSAIMFIQKHLISGIEYLLKHSKYNIIVPCVVGNHMRITDKVQHSTEQENSLEYYMYYNIKEYFSKESRIKFIIPNSDDCYIDVYKYKIRFVHGHQFTYKGGVGGLTVPLIKWLNIQNNNIYADYTVIGHYHQCFTGQNFICNGSLIGFNAYSKRFAKYEPPTQAFFLIDSRFGKTVQAPIILDTV